MLNTKQSTKYDKIVTESVHTKIYRRVGILDSQLTLKVNLF
jgi:hypothetical protein